ncbi:BTB domain-containing protein [Mycena indigotica]|uniref:BTB domain-containing protein n=1 Tax=Mycena indigotica TaxID=2126181 RepID=A0A8H6W697_9AGAR|nr:BTB domain-containing protein [Mycena indigotica]KAF7306467.1 BTB domain-containing protein [Mycena indigotica]
MSSSAQLPPPILFMNLQHHIYDSLINARAPDVILLVRATNWSSNYRLHRVVLTQAGFFSSLFTAGFAESSRIKAQPEVTIVFDDANITRAAFEFCISRLYGGGPPLHISSSLIPTTSHPLTTAFPFTSNIDSSIPQGHHPATPRFLLSLLATSVYLSIPLVAAQALSSILSTIGPHTVLSYLNFALGKVIPAPKPNEPDSAVGLEHIAEAIPSQDDASSAYSTVNEDPRKVSYYGAISDKIGESAASWLARWAPDILAYEERKAGIRATPAPTTRRRAKSDAAVPDFSNVPAIWDCGGLSVPWICALISSDALFVEGERGRYDFARAVVELRRRHGLVQEEEDAWKTLFEEGIHYCHMSMEDAIFISKDSSPTTKLPYVSIAVLQAAHWQSSILRQHITARPISPVAERPAPAPSPGSPVQREKELGITVTTAELRARLATSDPSLDTKGPYYLVPTDQSQRIGDNGSSVHPPTSENSNSVSMDELFTTSFSNAASGASSPAAVRPTGLARVSNGESNFFGIQARRYSAEECVAADPEGTARWTLQPPVRFGVEFWDAELLPDKARLYSQTIWCGGSLFNTYVQVTRKKEKASVQLGIYLHRQSSLDVPGASAHRGDGVRERVTSLVGTHNRGPSLPNFNSSSQRDLPTRSTTPVSVSSSLPHSISSSVSSTSSSSALGGCATLAPSTPTSPYRDSRPAVCVYFTISCASATGASQTRYASAPDVFSVSQSWGWKSSSTRTDEYIDLGFVDGGESGIRSREVSLRACVVLGLV